MGRQPRRWKGGGQHGLVHRRRAPTASGTHRGGRARGGRPGGPGATHDRLPPAARTCSSVIEAVPVVAGEEDVAHATGVCATAPGTEAERPSQSIATVRTEFLQRRRAAVRSRRRVAFELAAASPPVTVRRGGGAMARRRRRAVVVLAVGAGLVVALAAVAVVVATGRGRHAAAGARPPAGPAAERHGGAGDRRRHGRRARSTAATSTCASSGSTRPRRSIPTEPVMCFGPEASAETHRLLPAGTPVRLVRDVEARDAYGRLLAYVYRADGRHVREPGPGRGRVRRRARHRPEHRPRRRAAGRGRRTPSGPAGACGAAVVRSGSR